MAKKKFNTKLATKLAAWTCAGAIVIGGGGYFLKSRLFKESPQKYETKAEQDLQAGNFVAAYAAYDKAIRLGAKPTAEQYVRLAELARRAATQNAELQLADRAALNQALIVDPRYAPALKQLVAIEWEIAQAAPRPEQFQRVRELAERCVSADPTDKKAAALIPTATIQAWISGIDSEPAKVDADMTALAAIADADPGDAETAFVLSRAYIKRAGEALRFGRPREASAAYQAAGTLFDKALKSQDQNLLLHYRAMQIYRELARLDKPNAKSYVARQRDAIERAAQLAKPDQPGYVEARLEAASFYASQADDAAGRQRAGQIFEDLVQQVPKDQRVRLSYADFLARDPATRGKAIELLALPVERSAFGNTSLVVAQTQQLEFITRLTLQGYRLDQAASTTDAKEKASLLAATADDIAKLKQLRSEAPEPMVLEGRLQMLQGRPVDASRTFALAKQVMERRPDRLGGPYYDVLVRLADAYLQSQQTGPAKDLLKQVLDDPTTRNYIPARLMLVQILAREGDEAGARLQYTQAKQIIDSGASIGGSSEQVSATLTALQAAFSRLENRTEDSIATIKTMPEATRADRLRKGQLALQLGLFAEASRVLELAFTEDEKDGKAAALYVQALASDGRTETARQVLARALEVSPDELSLKILNLRFNNGSPEELAKLMRQEAERDPDEFSRAMRLYELAAVSGDRDEARKQLAAAAKLKPDDRRVLDQQFVLALQDQKFDDAEKLLPTLTSLNVDQAQGNLYRYKLAQSRGNDAEALRLARGLTNDLPQFGQSWLCLGEAYAKLGNYEEALGAFRQALDRQASNVDAIRGAINANYRLNRPDEANRLLTDALRRFPRDPGFQDMRIEHELSFGDYVSALAAREKQAEGREGDAQAQALLGNAYMKAAGAKQREGDVTASRKYARQAGEAFSRALAARPDNVQLFGAVARSAPVSDDPRWPESILVKAADSAALAANPEASIVLGEYYLSTGQADNAEKAVREAVRRGGTTVPTRRAAADLFLRLGKIDDAVSVLDGAENARTNLDVQQQRAETLIKAGRFDQAEKSISTLLRENPENLSLRVLMTIVLYNGQRYDEALGQIREILTRNPEELNAVYYRGLITLATGGDAASAVRDLQLVRDKGVLSLQMRTQLISAYLAARDNTGAIRELREALKVAPANKLIRGQLAELLLTATPPQPAEAQKVISDGLAQPELAGDPQLLMLKARAQLAQGDKAGAAVTGKLAVVNSRAGAAFVQAYLDLLLNADRPKDVLTESDAINIGDPKPSWLLIARAVAKSRTGDKDGAVAEFTSAVEAASAENNESASANAVGAMAKELGNDRAIASLAPRLDGPGGPGYRLITSMLYQLSGNQKQSLATLEPALANIDTLKPEERIRILKLAGLLLVSPGPQSNPDRAVNIYRQLLGLVPNDVLVLNNLAYLISEKVTSPNIAEALEYSGKAVSILRQSGTTEPLVFDTHGWLLVQSGRVAEGINLLNEALARRSFMEGHYHLGVAYTRAGPEFAKDAVDQLQRAQKLSDAPGTDSSYRSRINDALKDALTAQARALQQQQTAR